MSVNSFDETMKAAVYQAIYQRRDMRHFNGGPVDEAMMQRLFAAAHAGPSVGLMQPWRFIRIKTAAIKHQLHRIVSEETEATAEHLGERKEAFLQLKVQGILDCSELLVVSLMTERDSHVFGRRTLPEMDVASVACAIQNMWLAARAEGLGLGWVSLFAPEAVQQCLQMPKQAKPVAILCVGPVDEFYSQPMLIEQQWAERGDIGDYIMDDVWQPEKEARTQVQWQAGPNNPTASKGNPSVNKPEKKAQTIMVQGTTSDAGKSVMVSALCRIFSRQGASVVPFKPQNMALNSAVTAEGGEIGRAQAVQAQAAGLAPHTDMNPVLLKPTTDIGAQVIIHGKAVDHMKAKQYHNYKTIAMEAVLASHQRLEQQYHYVFVEGAGSPAEINLRDRDIANMGFAEAVDCPVILIADIDRGGVFAHLVGTLALLSESEQARVAGFVINRFRGDIGLLQSGLDWLEQQTGKPVLGVLPYLHGFHLEAEDALTGNMAATAETAIKVIVPALPRISNHTDFDALRLHPQVEFEFIGPNQAIPAADLIVLPGSKSVCADLQWLRDNGWPQAIEKHLRYGGKVIGICGGFQMLGEHITDPDAVESDLDAVAGLGWLPISTVLKPEKQLINRHGRLWSGAAVSGYEIHAGVSRVEGAAAITIEGQPEGCLTEQVMGTYLHGLFDHPDALQALLHWAGLAQVESFDYDALKEREINRLADAVEASIDWQKWREALSDLQCPVTSNK